MFQTFLFWIISVIGYLTMVLSVCLDFGEMPLAGYFIVMLILGLFVFILKPSMKYGSRNRENMRPADFLPLDSADKATVKRLLGREPAEREAGKLCLVRFKDGEETKLQVTQRCRVTGYEPGRSAVVMIIRHEMGRGVEYQVVSQKDYFMIHMFLGNTFLIMFISWIIIFALFAFR